MLSLSFLKPKKLVGAVTLRGKTPMFATGLYHNDKLRIHEVKHYAQNHEQYGPRLLSEMRNFMGRGGTLLVDEFTGELSRGAGAILMRLDSPGGNGEPVFATALDMFYQLDSSGRIIYPDKNPEQFRIPKGIVNTKYLSGGQRIYEMDWARFKPEHAATLLLILAIEASNVQSSDWLDAMLKPTESSEAVQAINRAITARDHEPGPVKSLAGNQLNKNTKVL